MSDKKEFSNRERFIAMAIIQLKAEPYCTECGASCIGVMDDIKDCSGAANIWTACTICGNEMVWTAAPNHIEMLKRIVELTEKNKSKVIEPFEFIYDAHGECAGLCGGCCDKHWSYDYEDSINNQETIQSDGACDNREPF